MPPDEAGGGLKHWTHVTRAVHLKIYCTCRRGVSLLTILTSRHGGRSPVPAVRLSHAGVLCENLDLEMR
jgi:hypothetical protein